ncbi:restriction endonuclease subunit S [Mannheimia pernigra]|uniref:restriction endonuclease subunit S n=1 Tax=Mannheimia pernigra TaxID=111844 RepID=UPI00131934E6|nr:restriction endonuclease subunit S [Mannheimia pernigra]QHB18093.1 restriction endonuclease subunit S [Mannheimia pernigra]
MSKLSDFISIKHGFAFKGEFITTEENANCLITPVNFSIGGGFKSDKFKYYTGEIPEKYILQPNDLIVTMTDLSKQADTLGYPALVPNISGKKMLHNQRIGLVEFLDNELDKEYLYFLMRTKEYRHQILSTATGATVHHTSPSKILDFEFEKPDLQTQKLIAQYLMILEEKIQLNTQTNQTLEAIAQAIFKSWFVDFDPVRAKAAAILDGKTSDEANLSAMAVICGKAIEDLSQTEYQELWEIADAFPSELVENAEFGEVPKGWEIVSISDKRLLEILKPKIDEFDGEKDYIATANVSNNSIVGELEKITYNKRPSRANMQPIVDSIWFAKMVGEHKEILVDKDDNCLLKNTILSTGFMGLKPKSKTKCFVYCFINSEYFAKAKNRFATGAVQIALTNGSFSQIKVVMPNEKVLDFFEKKLSILFSKIASNQRENRVLEKIRDELLPKLLSGEI